MFYVAINRKDLSVPSGAKPGKRKKKMYHYRYEWYSNYVVDTKVREQRYPLGTLHDTTTQIF